MWTILSLDKIADSGSFIHMALKLLDFFSYLLHLFKKSINIPKKS